MKIHFNTMMKNEEDLLNVILPIWEKYPIDKFVFYNDNSTDNSVEVIEQFLPKERFTIINDKKDNFSESYNRQRILDFSRDEKADFVFSIDVDELLSFSILDNFERFLKFYDTNNLNLFWYNVVNETVNQSRNDPQYRNNYRSFVLPMKKTANLNLNNWKYHTPRVPHVDLPPSYTKKFGVIHLQAINKKFYAIKQLWYKHHEFVHYNHSVEFINNRYDSVVNNLNFEAVETPKEIVEGINIDSKIFDSLLEKKGYLDFIKNNYNKSLITFGQEYV